MLERWSTALQLDSLSDVYETKDKRAVESESFLSCCAKIETDMKSDQLFQFLTECRDQINNEQDKAIALLEKNLDFDLVDFIE